MSFFKFVSQLFDLSLHGYILINYLSIIPLNFLKVLYLCILLHNFIFMQLKIMLQCCNMMTISYT